MLTRLRLRKGLLRHATYPVADSIPLDQERDCYEAASIAPLLARVVKCLELAVKPSRGGALRVQKSLYIEAQRLLAELKGMQP